MLIKYGDDYMVPDFHELDFPPTHISFVKPLAKYPTFGTIKWNLIPWTWSGAQPIFLLDDGFVLMMGTNMVVRKSLQMIHTKYIIFTNTKLPQLPVETHHIVARHPLAYPASFNPIMPLDIWSWILSFASFVSMTLLLIGSHLMLRPSQYSLYYATDYWKDVNWFKTSSLLLTLWAVSFFLINSAYQIDFRMGLISQTLEKPINSLDDVDMFNIHLYTFSIPDLAPVSKRNFFIQKNMFEYDRHFFRYCKSGCIKHNVFLLLFLADLNCVKPMRKKVTTIDMNTNLLMTRILLMHILCPS